VKINQLEQMNCAVPPTPPPPPPRLFEILVSMYFKKSIAMVTGFKSECKSKVTVTPSGGSACKAHAVTGDAFSLAPGTVL
jgi:hypothetical protein